MTKRRHGGRMTPLQPPPGGAPRPDQPRWRELLVALALAAACAALVRIFFFTH